MGAFLASLLRFAALASGRSRDIRRAAAEGLSSVFVAFAFANLFRLGSPLFSNFPQIGC
jgi:hypothetical protein